MSSSLQLGGMDQQRNKLHTRHLSSAELASEPSTSSFFITLQMRVQYKYLVLIIQVINFLDPIYLKTSSPLHTEQHSSHYYGSIWCRDGWLHSLAPSFEPTARCPGHHGVPASLLPDTHLE